jgi:hypothetical protein
MHAALVPATFRGVSCRRCGKPIRVRQAILNREHTFNQNEPGFAQQWCSRPFSHRCKTCGAEAIYSLSYISEFEEACPA